MNTSASDLLANKGDYHANIYEKERTMWLAGYN
jgi:hypothetical protein